MIFNLYETLIVIILMMFHLIQLTIKVTTLINNTDIDGSTGNVGGLYIFTTNAYI